jgi:carbonic anhydrase
MNFPQRLIDGYGAFAGGRLQSEQHRYRELAEHGQTPEIMVIGCCDSRVSPEVIFDARPGELFVVRNVGNLVPPFETQGKYHGVSAALEFAALNLRVKHIVVMGHSGCGGIRACLDHEALRQTEAAFVTNWVSMLDGARDRVIAANPNGTPAELRRALEREGIKTSLDNLRTFPCIQALEAKGRIKLHGTYFDIAEGSLSVLDQATAKLVAL